MYNATQNVDADMISSLEIDKDARHVESRPTKFSDFRNQVKKTGNFYVKIIDGGGDSLTGNYIICSLFTST